MDGVAAEQAEYLTEATAKMARNEGLTTIQARSVLEHVIVRQAERTLGYDPGVVDERHPLHPDNRDPWMELVERTGTHCEFCHQPVMFIDNIDGGYAGSKLLVNTTGTIRPGSVNSDDLLSALVFPDGTGFTLSNRLPEEVIVAWEDQQDNGLFDDDEPVRHPIFALIDTGRRDLSRARVVEVHWDRCKPSSEKRKRLSRKYGRGDQSLPASANALR